MDVPVMLNPQLSSTVNSGLDLAVDNSNSSGEGGFSKHFEKNIDRLNSQHAKPEPSSGKEPEKVQNVRGLADMKNEKEATSLTNAMTSEMGESEQMPTVIEGLPRGLKHILEETDLPEQAPGLSTAIGVISDKLKLEVDITGTVVSGNELPQAADIAENLEEELLLIAGRPEKEIVFDPLNQAKDSSVQLASLTSGHLPAEKIKFNGKSSPLDKFQGVEVSDVQLGRMKNIVPDTTGSMFAKETGAINVAQSTEGALLNVAAQSNGQVQQVPVGKSSLQLETPMNSPKWGENFTQRVQWLVGQSISGAQIRLNPQHMGPIEVRIQMQNEQATVSFAAQHGATREAIDAALPRLREMFNEQNVNVVDIDVSQHSFAEQREQQQAANNKEAHFDELDRELGEQNSDQQRNDQGREYNGLFSEFV